ncbi:MAG: PAS domain-containing sensor histidine kinase [Armatimonadota bacterium]
MNKDLISDFSPDPNLRRLLDEIVSSNKSDALIILHKDKIVNASESALNLLGYESRDEFVGLTLAGIMTEESAALARNKIWDRISGSWRNETLDYDFIRKDGQVVKIDVSPIPWPLDSAITIIHIKEVASLQTNKEVLENAVRLNKTLAEEMPVGFILTNKLGNVVYMNCRATELVGYHDNDLCCFEVLISPSEKDARDAYLNALNNGVSSRIPEIKLIRKDGTEFWASVSWHSILNKRGHIQAVCIVISDITEHKETAEALTLAEGRYRLLAENALDILWETDSRGIFTFVSQAVTRVLGYSPDECIGKNLISFIDPSDSMQHEAFLQYFLNTPQDLLKGLEEVKMIKRDQTSIWMEISWSVIKANGLSIGFQGISRDISKRKIAEEALRESEERFRTLVANLPDVIYRCHMNPDWSIQLLNNAIQDLSGYPPSDFVNRVRRFANIIHPEDRALVTDTIYQALAKREQFSITYRIIHADGSIRWVFEKGQGIFGPDGKIMCLDGVISDITEERRVNEERQKAHEDMQRAYQLQQQFLNNITHEVRTPLTAVQGYAKMILEGLTGQVNEEQSSLLRKMLVCTNELLTMVGSILEIARLKSGVVGLSPRICCPRTIVDKCILAVGPQLEAKGLNISVASENDSQQGIYDEGKLTAIITNLLSNAVKFTDKGGINVILSSGITGMEVIVADTGMGILNSDIESIFDEFQQLDYPRKHKPTGFGIGLAIVATMVRIIGANLTVSSKKDVGTAFTLQVPVLGPNS